MCAWTQEAKETQNLIPQGRKTGGKHDSLRMAFALMKKPLDRKGLLGRESDGRAEKKVTRHHSLESFDEAHEPSEKAGRGPGKGVMWHLPRLVATAYCD
jgi:hypothetical protein